MALKQDCWIPRTSKDALGTHARDELGITEVTRARPLQAAMFISAGIGSLLVRYSHMNLLQYIHLI